MRHKALAIVPILLLMLSSSKTALANGGSGGAGNWWEGMSGPGPWGGVYGFFSLCYEALDFGKHLENCSIDDKKMWLNLGGSVMWTGEETDEQAEVQNPSLRAYSFEPSVDLNIHNLFDYAPIFLGIGAGVHYFDGRDVGFWRASIEPRVSIVFLKVEKVYLQLRYTAKYFYKGFDAADFGDPTGTYDSDGGDTVQTLALVFGIDF